MCLAVPLKMTQINGNEAIGERSGISRSFRVDLIKDPKPGDYVIVHAGFAIEKMSREQAMESEAAAAELENALREIEEERRARQIS